MYRQYVRPQIMAAGIVGLAAAFLIACQHTAPLMEQSSKPTATTRPLFSETTDVIPFEQHSRRKWDNAVIADLDQDGLLDVLITEHSREANIFWNNGGVFSAPQTVIRGDTHGIAAADYDRDGRMDLIIAQGGGGGSKPRLPVSFQVNHDRSIKGGNTFAGFERTRGRAVKLFDGDNNGSLDLLLSAFPLESQKKGANHIYQQAGDGQFSFKDYLPTAKWLGYKTLVTDFNNDHINDVIFYGGENMVAVQGNPGLKYRNASQQVFGDLANISHVSSIAEIDYDNDGDFDLLLTRAKHQFERESFFDQQLLQFAFFARNEKFQFEDLHIDGDFELENLQMAYPDYDVFVGKNRQKLPSVVDNASQRSIRLSPEEANGWPEKITANGLYIGYLGDGMWRIGGETKSPTAGVVKNVISKPTVKSLEPLPVILLENQQGVFVNATEKMRIAVAEPTTSAAIGDYNNDGWSDIFIVRYGNPASQNEQILYLNERGKFFNKAENHGLVSKELGATGGGAEAFDYDRDGDLDLLYANERGRWHLFTNQTAHDSQHNFITVTVGWSPDKQASAQGATLTVSACGQNYTRVVGATSSPFSHSANNQLHIGLGSCSNLSAANVRWSNDEQQTVKLDQQNLAGGVFVGREF